MGSSVAGVKTAEALRSHGWTDPVTLIGAEDELPYDKPPLSKELLAGVLSEPANLLLTHDAAERAQIALKLGSPAVALDTHARLVTLANGERVGYDTLVASTGARARPSPWGQPDGVHLLRTIADVRALRGELVLGGHLVVIGGGFIGAEASATALGLGMTVQIVDPAPVPMSRVLGEEVGQILSSLHWRHGVETLFGIGVSRISVDNSTTTPAGHPGLTVHLDNGSALSADTVLVGIGTITNHEWMEGSGIRLENGVVCDQFCRVEGTLGIYAAGDLARWFHPRHDTLTRVEHWTNAVEQAQTVAYNIMHPDQPQPYAPVEYIWSDQYEWKVQITGQTGRESNMIVQDEHRADRFAVLYTDARGRYSGAMTANWPRALVACRRAVGSGVTATTLRASLEELALRKTSSGVATP